MTPRENPFRVDRVSTLPFLGGDVPALADQFLRLGRAAIVGPHGAGKSTLLRAIGEELTGRGVGVLNVGLPGSATRAERRAAIDRIAVHATTINTRQTPVSEVRRRPGSSDDPASIRAFGVPQTRRLKAVERFGTDFSRSSETVVLFDGFEQFNWLERRRVLKTPRLLVTVHRPIKLPTLATLRPTLQMLDEVLSQLMPEISAEMRRDAHAIFVRNAGDVRATLFELYDVRPPLP